MSTLVWISGASGGIGAALAASVPFDDATTFDISRSGGTDGTTHVPADLSDPSSWPEVGEHFARTIAEHGPRRVVFVHNAGTIEPIGFAGEVDPTAYQRNVLLNAAAPQVLGAAFVAAVTASDTVTEATLLMLSSGAATKPYEGWSSYCGGKAAVDHWVRTVGAEQQHRGGRVRVVAVAPGVVGTGMQAYIREQDADDFPARQKFVDLFEDGDLVAPEAAAKGIWGLLDRDDIPTGAVVDLRKI